MSLKAFVLSGAGILSRGRRDGCMCGRESFIIALCLFLHKELLDDVGMGGKHRLRIGWAHTAVEHQSPRH